MRPTPNLFVPKLFTCLREGYSWRHARADVISGLTVAVVALPLSMALAIASGATPDKGLLTAIVAGFLISALGGSRHQIGGPTGAFVVVVFNVIRDHGYDGLLLATLMAGVMLVLFGLARLGAVIKYIPYPVITGFTAGIAVIIFSSQIVDLFGLTLPSMPGEVAEKWVAYAQHMDTVQWPTVAVAAGSLATILVLRRWRPRWPFFLIAVGAASVFVWLFAIPVETIGSRFGEMPHSLPTPTLPDVSLERLRELVPSAFTIALLAGIESLLSAMIADGMTGRRHRSNVELIGEGIANIGSALVGGLPATGAIARTATNIRSGALTPISGIMHAVFLLLFVLLLGPVAQWFPLPSLAAVLVIVAWNMSEIEAFRALMKSPPGDRLVLLLTFALTVLVDLTVAIQVGVVLSALLFMHRMAQATQITGHNSPLSDASEETTAPGLGVSDRARLPTDVESFRISGPLFFGAAQKLTDVLEQVAGRPRTFILRLDAVPEIDATGAQALGRVLEKLNRKGTKVIIVGIQPQPRHVLKRMGYLTPELAELAGSYESVVQRLGAPAKDSADI
jgi:sulfate permease, SulP family